MHLKSQVLSVLNPRSFPEKASGRVYSRLASTRHAHSHLSRRQIFHPSWDAKALAHFAANLCQKYPITIGRRTPRLLRSSSRVPPKSDALTWSGQVPAKSKFVVDVIAESSSGTDCAHLTISGIC